MKQFILSNAILVLLVSISFFACKKDSASSGDSRDAFVGQWKGAYNYSIGPISDTDDEQIFTISKDPNNSKKIIIDGNSATVSGNTFKYDQFTKPLVYLTVSTTLTVNGTGSVNGASLSETGSLSAIYQGQSYSGSWSRTSVKQP